MKISKERHEFYMKHYLELIVSSFNTCKCYSGNFSI